MGKLTDAMAAKRVASSSVNWAEFAKKIPAAQKPSFNALKTKQDGYVRVIGSLPENLPAIDWAVYQGKVSATMVDDFKKKYEALTVPYPKDTVSAQIAAEAVEQKAAYDKFVAESNVRVAAISTELAKWESMMPLEEMTKEEAMHAVPHLVPEHGGPPQFWPFTHSLEDFKKEKIEWHKREKEAWGMAADIDKMKDV